MAALNLDRSSAAKTLARWQVQRWLTRVGHGLYAPVPLDARATEQVLEDPWVLVPALFGEAYVGGWTAAEHWDLTEQLFRDTLVFTTKHIRARRHEINGLPFVLRHIQSKALFGTRTIWRGPTRVQISDIHRTIIDILADPSTGGGIRHVADCFAAYLKHSSASAETLIAYAGKFGNGAVYKRMGFLASAFPDQGTLTFACRELMTQGNAKLDPDIPCPRLVKAWRVWIPENWSRAARRHTGDTA
jgi:predicted transcriptional regulator of viral defense system